MRNSGRAITAAAYRLPALWRRFVGAAWDASAWGLAALTALALRTSLNLDSPQLQAIALYAAIAAALQIIGGLATQLYLGRNRLGSFSDAIALSLLVAGIAVVTGAGIIAFVPAFPVWAAALLPPLALLIMVTGRAVFRLLKHSGSRSSEDAETALVYGAGDAGFQVAHLVDIAENPPYAIVGFVDDNPDKRSLRVGRYRVRGTGADLIAVAHERGATTVILAISAASPQLIESVSQRCESAGLKFVTLPPLREMIGGQVRLDALRELNVADLLGRRQVQTDLSQIASYITGKTVLVTGAGGSIGQEIAKQVHHLGAASLVSLDRDESALHGLQLQIFGQGLLDSEDMVLCDIRDYDALKAVFEKHRPDVVFHAAALKHLPMLQRFPGEGWKTNVLGTLNVLRCADETGVAHFVNISTDKAAAATNVLGQTKRIAERLTAWYALKLNKPWLSVRFGNVLGSRGSVLISFKSQIDSGGPVTVTHPDVTRYFMTIPEACELVIQAGAIGHPGDVMVLDMGEPVKILDVAKRLIAESGKEVPITFTGLRAGEKLHEVLFSEAEAGAPTAHPLISGVRIPALDPAELPQALPDGAERLQALL